MIRRLFRWRKVSEARPSSWLDCDERECPVQHLVSREAGSAPNELAHGESLVGRGHRCSAARVDDYEGVSWLGRLDWPEWPVHEQSFENREEDLSVASCVESLWSRRCLRGRRGAQSLPAEADIAGRAGFQDWCSLRNDDCVRDAVMAKLGLQVTCLGSVSPMSKSYPGQKAIFSAYRGLSLYRSGGDTTMTAAAAAQPSLTSRSDLRDDNDTETKPGAGDHGHSYYQDGKYHESNKGVKDEQNERKVLHQRMHEPHLTDAGCKSYETYLTKTPVVVSTCSNCSHLEGLLEEHEANAKKEGTLNESGDDGGALNGLVNTSGSLDASTLSGDIKLDHIEDIGSRLHSTPTRTNGGCGVEEDRRLQLGLGDFDHLGGTVTCSRARGDTLIHVKVTCSGDCDQDSGGSSRLPATSSPIPTEADTGGACLGSLVEGSAIENEATVLDDELCNAEFAEAKTSADESFSSDMTVTRQSYGDSGDDAESEFASQQGSESAGEFIDAGFDTDYSEGAAVDTDFLTHVDLHSNFQEKRAARACGQQCLEWLDIDVYGEQQPDDYFGVLEARPIRNGAEYVSTSTSCEVFPTSSSRIYASQITTSKRRLTYPSGPPELSAVLDNEQRQLCSSPTNSIDGQLSVSSCGSFFTVDSYDDDPDFPNTKLVAVTTNTESTHELCSQKPPSPSSAHSPSRPESQSFESYEETVGSSPAGHETNNNFLLDTNLVEPTCSLAAYSHLRPEEQHFQGYKGTTSASCHAKLDAGGACGAVGPDEPPLMAGYEPAVPEPHGSSSTTTLSFNVLEAGENASSISTNTSGRSSSSSNSTKSTSKSSRNSSSKSSSGGCSSSSNSTKSTNKSSRNSSSKSSSGSCSSSSPAEHSEEDNAAVKSLHTPPQSTSPLQSNMEYESFSNRGESSPFPLQNYSSCRDFLRRLTDANPELSYSLSTSFASDNCGVSEDASIEDVCSQIFSSYNESFTHFEEVQSLPALARSNAAEMLTCPELRPLRLGGNAGDVFQPVLRRDQNKRLKRSTVPAAAASDTKATISKTSDKWCHMSSPSSVSMPDLKHSQNGTWPSDVQEQNGAAATSDASLSSVRPHTASSRKAVGFAL